MHLGSKHFPTTFVFPQRSEFWVWYTSIHDGSRAALLFLDCGRQDGSFKHHEAYISRLTRPRNHGRFEPHQLAWCLSWPFLCMYTIYLTLSLLLTLCPNDTSWSHQIEFAFKNHSVCLFPGYQTFWGVLRGSAAVETVSPHVLLGAHVVLHVQEPLEDGLLLRWPPQQGKLVVQGAPRIHANAKLDRETLKVKPKSVRATVW